MSERPRVALVTGASGFIGSHLVDTLVARGWRTRCLVRATSDLRWLPRDRVELATGDVADPSANLDEAVRGASVVFHLAAITSSAREPDYERVNVDGTRRLAAAVARRSPDALMVFCSSLAAAGPSGPDRMSRETDPSRPVSAYGRSKLAAETALSAASIRHVVVRPPAVYGPRDVDILAAFRLARRGLALRIAPAGQRLSMVHVSDLAAGLYAAAERDVTGIHYVSGPGVHTWEEIASAVAGAVGRAVRVIPVPRAVASLVAGADVVRSRITGRKPLLTPDRIREMAAAAWTCDDASARAELGYSPAITLEAGMRETAEWYRRHGWL